MAVSVPAIFGANQDIGKGIADLLVDKLVNHGPYSVIERADATSATKIGKILGVDAIIIGSITQFGRYDKKTSVGGGGLGGVTGRFGQMEDPIGQMTITEVDARSRARRKSAML